MTIRKQKNQGMNWIRPEKRLAIYLRDGLSCAYCGASVESGTKLTLDHIIPYVKGGTNSESNLVTCCHTCNSSRGIRSMTSFAIAVAGYLNHGVTADHIITHVNRTRRRVLDIEAARELIARRGGFSNVLNAETVA